MVTQNPRLNVVLDNDLYIEIRKIAKKRGISLSLAARDLLKEAVERQEDAYWHKVAAKREKNSSTKKFLSHDDIWE